MRLTITEFAPEHVAAAESLALEGYLRARDTADLPFVSATPGFLRLAGNGMGVAAFDGGEIAGFLCAYPVHQNAFGTTSVTGAYVPSYAHGAKGENRGRIYAEMYEAAAGLWVEAGAASHTITLYAHDRTVVNQFFRCGFGLRCVDAVKPTNEMDLILNEDNESSLFAEITQTEAKKLYPLHRALVGHFRSSPIFMAFPEEPSEEEFAANILNQEARYFTASQKGEYAAYIKITKTAEHFAAAEASMANITGAFCLPAYRGTGLFRDLLAYVNNHLRSEGYAFLGVDYESFNPTARGFWEKHFTPYTASVTRRIDENVFIPRDKIERN